MTVLQSIQRKRHLQSLSLRDYPAASAKSKEDAAFAERAHEATLKLQSGDKQGMSCNMASYQECFKADLKKNYDNLNVQLIYGKVNQMHSHILTIWLIR